MGLLKANRAKKLVNMKYSFCNTENGLEVNKPRSRDTG